jgi:hypothetical protein
MALDVVSFHNVAGRAGTVALQNVAGLADSHVTVNGNNVIVPDRCKYILGVFAQTQQTAGSVTQQIILSSPKLRETSLLELTCWAANGAIAAATQIPGNNPPFNDFKESPIELKPGEALQCLTSVDVAAVAEAPNVVVFLTDGVIPQSGGIKGRIETVYAQAAAAAVINVWSPTALNLRQALRAGTYAVVGMRATGVSMTAARLIFGNQGERPGCIATNTATGSPGATVDPCKGLFRYGRLGVWGFFSHVNPPTMEVLCSIADAAATVSVALDVIRVGD